MASTLVDTNVLVDVFDPGSPWQGWCERELAYAKRLGSVVINQIIYAELAAGFPSRDMLDAVLHPTRFDREDLPWEAGFLAGKAYITYRRGGGDRRSPLPDFYIGAHALVKSYRLLTRDDSRFRTYFPSVEVISPDVASMSRTSA